MRYLVISDIHGSSYFLNEVLNKAQGKYDQILILGDVLYHGPRNDLPKGYAPKEVIKILNPLKDIITCVRGNCDAEVDQMVLQFTIHDTFDLLINNKKVHLEHGHHLDFDNLSKYKSNVIMYGHYHIPRLEKVDDVLLVNPGSISIPKSEEGNTYVIIDENTFTLYSLEKELKSFVL